jgi:hypothetical protein
MTWFLVPVAVIVLLAVPFFAADSRDGADWKPAALSGPARGTRRTVPFSGSPGALLVRRVVVGAFASHRAIKRTRTSARTRPGAKIAGALVDRAAEH